jgi:hypothetical protein
MSTAAAGTPLEVRLPQSFPVRPYVPDGGMSLGGALQLVGTLGLAGIILGGVASWISRFFYLVLLFPIGIGLCLGWVGCGCIRAFKIRRPLTCGVAGFVAGCLAMLSMHSFDYRHFEATLAAEAADDLELLRTIARNARQIEADPSGIPEEERAQVLEFIGEMEKDPQLRRALLVDSLWSYLDFAAHQGVELKRGAGHGINLGYWGSYIYWGIEALIVAGIAFGVMKGAAAEPFCGDCLAWKAAAAWGPLSHPDAVEQSLREGRVEQFESDPAAMGEQVVVTAFRCPTCEDAGEIDVRVERLTVNSKGEVQRKQTLQVTYPAEAYSVLAAACGPRESLPPATAPSESPETDADAPPEAT